MPLPTSGDISLNDVAIELGRASGAAITLGETEVRSLAGKATGDISLSDLYGKTKAAISYASVSGSGANGSSLYYNYTVKTGCTTSGAWVSGGSYIVVTKMSNTQYRFYCNRQDWTATGTYRVTATPTGGGISAYVDRAVSVSGMETTSSCFTGDSLVRMADGSLRRIDQIVPGDWIATPFGYSEVDWIRMPLLGERPLIAMDGGKCKTSGEHCIWSKDAVTGKEWWATRDIEWWRYEAENNKGPGLNGIEPLAYNLVGEGVFATEEGWLNTQWDVVTEAPADTPLYHLYLKDHASYFVDGFLVVGELPRLEMMIDWTKFTWTADNPQLPVYMSYDYELPEVNRNAFKGYVDITIE